MYLIGFVLYIALCAAIAWYLPRVLMHRAKAPRVRWMMTAILAPIAFLLPLADEIAGHFQFERLCREAKDVKIHGTIVVGEDLYTADGRWRLGQLDEFSVNLRSKEVFRLNDIIKTYIRAQGPVLPQEVPAPIPIRRYEDKIYDIKTGRLLAEWRQYGTRGGWISRNFEAPFIVRPQCMPDVIFRSELNQSILKFKGSEVKK